MFKVFFGFILLFVQFSFAEKLMKDNPVCVCDSQEKDPLEEPQSFNFGKFQGQCVDSCRFRPARILSKDVSGSHLKSDEILVGNILHEGAFYKSALRLEDFDRLEVGFEEFFPAVNHVFLRFYLKDNLPSLILKNQVDMKKASIQSRSLVVSPEGIPPKGLNYNLFESYFGNYVLLYRLVSGEEMDLRIQLKKHPIHFYPVTVASNQVAKILMRSIQDSEELKLENQYQLFSNNCSTSTLKLIRLDLENQSQIKSSFWNKLQEGLPISGPIGTLNVLFSKKLIQNKTVL